MRTTTIVDKSNATDLIVSFEMGELSRDNIISLFQYLLDSGLVWTLQGNYGRMTKALLDEGYLVRR